MKKLLVGFLSGAVLFAMLGVAAVEYDIIPNPYKVLVNGQEKQLEGYNINGSSYFKLRDIGEQIGFNVDFKDENIVIGVKGDDGLKVDVPLTDIPVATPEEIEARRKDEYTNDNGTRFTKEGMRIYTSENGKDTVGLDDIAGIIKNAGYPCVSQSNGEIWSLIGNSRLIKKFDNI